MEENNVVNETPIEEQTPSTSVEETPEVTEQPGGDDSSQEATQEEDSAKYVPYDRFKQVNDKAKQYEEFIKTHFGNQAPTQKPQTTTPSLTADEEGYVDPNQILAAAEERAYQRMQQHMSESKEWEKAVSKYPELEQDDDLATAVTGYRNTALAQRGELLTFSEAAERLLGRFKKAETKAVEEGKRQAQVSERVQKRAVVDTPSTETVDPKEKEISELRTALRSPDVSNRDRDKIRIRLLELMG